MLISGLSNVENRLCNPDCVKLRMLNYEIILFDLTKINILALHFKYIKIMRKTILSIAIILGASSIFAQDLTSKKGENYLPEAGDWAIGIDAVPLLDYIGNIFGKTADNNHAGNIWTPNNPSFAINGKYFYKDDLAFRGGIRLGFSTNSQTVMVGERGVAAPTTN